MKFSKTDAKTIERAIERLEKKTAAEIVVIIDSKAALYSDIEYLITLIIVFLGIIINIVVPWNIAPWFFFFDIVTLAIFAYFLIYYSNIKKYFVSKNRKKLMAETAALANFSKYKIYNTQGRTGILVYVAVFEKEIRVIADVGILTFLPQDSWEWWLKGLSEVTSHHGNCKVLVEHLERLGERLEKYLPAKENDKNELPNTPLVNI